MKRIIIVITGTICFLLGLFFLQLKLENITYLREISLDTAQKEIPAYFTFLSVLQEKKFEFWSFAKYWKANKDSLPENLIVIRHDIHTNDVQYAYSAYLIERELLKSNKCATYYVMYEDPLEKQKQNYAKKETAYLDLIRYLAKKNVDVQPHISPIDFLLSNNDYHWEYYPTQKLEHIFNENYDIIESRSGIEIKCKKEDIFQFDELNYTLQILLKKYNQNWTKKTGLEVQSYAAHGSQTPANYVLENSMLLNQNDLLATKIYEFDTYNTKIFNKLTYLSDNTFPDWMTDPDLIKNGRYQLLMHPGVWNENYQREIKIKNYIREMLSRFSAAFHKNI